jgi:glucose/arabinose dehydrogenase/mono/diheme cytochrome c family protein
VELPPGYRLELVLSEPQVKEPVVTVFDGNGRMYVAEMRSYMRDIDASDEKRPESRVSLHWSSKGDGVFDQHSVFIDGLMLPRILLPLKDSLLVQETDTSDIFEYRDTNGDGVADDKKLWFAGEPRKANLEHQTSGLIWCADNALYTTYNSYRLRWTPGGVVQEPTAPNGGQWGMTQDDWGKPWIVNAGGELGPINFQQPILYGAFKVRNEYAVGYKEVWPLVPIPDVQGGPNRFRPEEKTLNHFTATCGGDVYRGDRLPRDLEGDLLFCEPVGRLIRRTKIEVRDGVTYLSNPYDRSEFIRSRDPYFRPVNLVTAPDGTLYITDMYRGIIQEGNWTKKGSYLRGVIQDYDLDKATGRGRIWRLVYDGQMPGPQPRMLDETPAKWIAYLAHPNGWWRDTAQKLLVLAQDKSVVPALQAMVRTHGNPLARFHALWTLEGLDAIDEGLVREKLNDSDAHLRVAAIRVSESLFKKKDVTLKPEVLTRFKDADPNVAIQAMMTATLLKWPEARPLIQKSAVASSSVGVREIGAQLLNPLSAQIPGGYTGDDRARLEKGQQIYMELCFACHGVDGKGTPMDGKDATLAPPLAKSKTITGHRDATIAALLSGVSGPVEGKPYDAQMAPMGANDDDWIAAIVSYVRTGFGNGATIVRGTDVARVRSTTGNRKDPWTREEIVRKHPQILENNSAWKFTTNHRRKGGTDDAVRGVKLPFSAGPGQVGGTWLQIELPEVATLSDLRFDCGKMFRNYPRAFDVQLSIDGEHWSEPVVSGKTTNPAVELSFAPTAARFVRIVETANAPSPGWTIDTVALFRAPLPHSSSD